MNIPAYPAGLIFTIIHVCSKDLFVKCNEEPPGLWLRLCMEGEGRSPETRSDLLREGSVA